MHTFWQDVRYGLRALGKNRGFAVIAILTLALGIGANTALFSIVNGVLLSPLPYRNPEQLVSVYARQARFNTASVSYPNFLDWQRENHSFSSMAAFRADNFNLTGLGEPERVKVNMISATFFPILGVQPMLGRHFTEQEDKLGGSPVVLLSEGLWKRKFGAARDVVGSAVDLDATSYTVVGVIPATAMTTFKDDTDVYTPIGQYNEPLFRDRGVGMGTDAVGRLKPGVTLEQARSDMDAIARHLAEIYPGSNKDSGVALISLKESVVGDIRPFLLVLLAAVGFVLLIACANVANLLLARSTGRMREFAIRTALGASRGRMVRQILTESVLLALGGGALGLLVAAWGTQAAIKALPDALPRAEEVHLDGRVLLFTFAASLFAGILFGLVPSLKTSGTRLQEMLKEGGRGAGGTRHRAQGAIVALEMALALVLLAGAGLMIRSLTKLWSVDPGFDARNVSIFGVAPARQLGKTPTEIRARFRSLRDAFAAVPGVQAASLTMASTPMRGDSDIPLWLDNEAKPASHADMKVSLFYGVQPDYLQLMKIPLKRGRFIKDADTDKAPFIVVIDEDFARLFFGGSDPIGRHVNFDVLNMSAEIVGIVGHVKQWGLDENSNSPVHAQCYFAVDQIPDPFVPLIARGFAAAVRTDYALANAGALQQAATRVNSGMVVWGVRPMTDVVVRQLAAKRFAMTLLGIFAALATVLSCVGIYGVISYIVGQRTQEIGIRMALGAGRGTVLRMMLAEAGKMAAIGVGLGLAGSLALMRLMSSMLFGVSPYDPLTLSAVAVLLSVIAMVACLIPARRATKVDPLVALRYE
jgi:predicted permease